MSIHGLRRWMGLLLVVGLWCPAFAGPPSTPTITGVSPASGPIEGGTVVTITGTLLTSAQHVTFGATEATSFRVISASEITATSPAHAGGVVDITVATASLESSPSAADQFTYTAPTATITVNVNTNAGGAV